MRLERLQREFPDELRLTWRAYLLRPYPEVRPFDEFVSYTRHWSRPAALEPGARFAPWGDAAPPTHSLPAALAAKVAATFGPDAFARYHHRLFEAYFSQSRTISDVHVLRNLAVECGIDADEFARRFDEDRDPLVARIAAEFEEGYERGVTGVPAVLVDHEHLVTGALDLDQYRRIVRTRTASA